VKRAGGYLVRQLDYRVGDPAPDRRGFIVAGGLVELLARSCSLRPLGRI
jgi:hypothetical protein